VGTLKLAWRFDINEQGEPETNPLIVGRMLYAYSPGLKVIALDGATGKLQWKFDSGIKGSGPDRGLAYWSDGKHSRLFAGVMHYLYAIDPRTGRPIESFGEHGRIDLRKNLIGDPAKSNLSLTSPVRHSCRERCTAHRRRGLARVASVPARLNPQTPCAYP
jgi:quinoprotein glucose dehydrogenase